MIEIIEKEPYKDFDRWNLRECLMYPTFMIKNNKEYFILNRRSPQDNWEQNNNRKVLEILQKTNGKYTCFHNTLLEENLYNFLNEIVKNRYSFEDLSVLLENKEIKYCDFCGNLKEVSSAFHYRIYDDKMIANIKSIFNLIKNREWIEASTKIKEGMYKYEKNLGEECEM